MYRVWAGWFLFVSKVLVVNTTAVKAGLGYFKTQKRHKIAVMQKSEVSLRERRKDRTWKAIHESAQQLVQERGLKGTTTEEIAVSAGVSPRTFFNYFATKEDAVLGLRKPRLAPEMLEADAGRHDVYVFERITHLLLDILVASFGEDALPRIKKKVEQYPELRNRIKWIQIYGEQILTDFLLTIDWKTFAANGRKGEFPLLGEGVEPDADTFSRVRASVLIASAAVRHLELHKGAVDLENIDRYISDTVAMFRMLLRED